MWTFETTVKGKPSIQIVDYSNSVEDDNNVWIEISNEDGTTHTVHVPKEVENKQNPLSVQLENDKLLMTFSTDCTV